MISIGLFGSISVHRDGAQCAGLSAKQRQILGILALHPGSPVPRGELAEHLWEGSPPRSYVGTLDSYVCLMRRAMGLKAGRSSVLATTAAGFVLTPGADVEVDLTWFRRLSRAADVGTGRPALEWAEEAVELAEGVLLGEVPYAAWAVRAREEVDRDVVGLCTRGAQRANGLGEYARASGLARRAVDRDPLCEDAWRQLMLAQWFAGNRGSALMTYAELRTAMKHELGDEPGQQSRDLYLTILTAGVAPPGAATRSTAPITTLLRLLRLELELAPGVRPPARDAQLSEVAIRVLQTSGH
ncbi:AfsR/SARP family transcriptional regulator [Nocardioides aurantiacus]|uniref:DNA-binding SARP family transcriptional activator n=1 Tax=Nocardioides aurantiacus TaxID=86796 RepID=A0A3N2CRT8_9ACTN|nr:BTAD domain-containing putative transcriptional regulator [Nocardioides aurantiacus]ROR90245.1 DNA-binding SARP family transcriptional activator [Nocardioides aurantiacus]